MDKLRDVLRYLCVRYPNKQELSNARLTKMVYLADWESAKRRGHQTTPIQWVFNHYGPFVYDVLDTARRDPQLRVEDCENMYGDKKTVVSVAGTPDYEQLSDDEKRILDRVIETTKDLRWDDFIEAVYSTYPIRARDRYEKLDLGALAAEWKSGKTESPEPVPCS